MLVISPSHIGVTVEIIRSLKQLEIRLTAVLAGMSTKQNQVVDGVPNVCGFISEIRKHEVGLAQDVQYVSLVRT